jgi:hypothetical protein
VPYAIFSHACGTLHPRHVVFVHRIESQRPPMRAALLKETKLTDFFQRRPSLILGDDLAQSSSQSPTLGFTKSPPSASLRPSLVAKRKPGRSKGSGKKEKHNYDESIHVSSNPSSRPGSSGAPRVPRLKASLSSPPNRGTSGSSSKQRPRKPKGGRNEPLTHNKEAYLLRSSLKVAPRVSPTIISPFDSASQYRARTQHSSPHESPSSPQVSTPSKRRLDDSDGDTVSVTSSGVPLSLYYTPRQMSSPSSSKAPISLLATNDFSSPPSNKRRRLESSRMIRSHHAPVTPKSARRNEVIPTSQSSEAGLYSPMRLDVNSIRRDDVQESVENWRRGRSAYRCDMSPLRFTPCGDYSTEIDRPLSPLTSCPKTTSLGSPLTSFTDIDTVPSDVDLDDLPVTLPQNALPTPSSASEGKSRPSFAQIIVPPSVRPVTPPPSSPEPEQPTAGNVAPKDSKMRTAEIIAEIWANVRAKSISDGEDSYLHAPIKDQLSSDEEDEPFWKRDVSKSR